MTDNPLLSRLSGLDARFEEVATLITDPAVIADQPRYVRLTREYRDLQKILDAAAEYKGQLEAIEEARTILADEADEEMRGLAREQLDAATAMLPRTEERIKLLLVPADPDDAKNAIVEIRGGTGGDEAALFAGDLFRMYQKYAERKGWQLAVSSFSEGAAGGFKEIIFSLSGADVYGTMKYESGVHRVQRVPETETQGRIHTSTVTVAVMPEAEEVELEINPKDLRIDTFRSSGAGGQHINKTSSAIRVTHLPTGMECQDQRSQRENKDRALKVLRSRLLQQKQDAYDEEYNARRQSQVGSGDRSEKIRTYNFPQDRVTDHRIGLTLRNLQGVLDGDLDRVVEPLILADREEKLKQSSTEEGK